MSGKAASDIDFSELLDDTAAWQVFASGQAEGRIVRGERGLRLEYDFHEGTGFVAMRREWRGEMPDSFGMGFVVSGNGGGNALECKLADPSGENVWRHTWESLGVLANEHLALDERGLKFAWGPQGAGAPGEVGAVELVVVAGPGGRGVLEFSSAFLNDESLGEMPELVSERGARVMDFGRVLRFGGIVLHWHEPELPKAFRVEVQAADGQWIEVQRSTHALGGKSWIAVPQGEACALRVLGGNEVLDRLCGIEIKPDAFSATANEFIHHVAAECPRGWFPRYWHREQSYWTPLGNPQGMRRGLVNEEGLVEVDEGAFSLEPFIFSDGKLLTWAEVECRASMAQGGIPVPTVQWLANDGLQLEISPWVDGVGENLTLHVRYRIFRKNTHENLIFNVSARPYLVNPPWQVFRNFGGRSKVCEVACKVDGMRVDDRDVCSNCPADAWGAATFEEEGVLHYVARGEVPPRAQVEDAQELASGVLSWRVEPGEESFEVVVSVPFFAKHGPFRENARDNSIAEWRELLERVRWELPEAARHAVESFRTAAGHILINREGPAIQPGPRRYTRSWVRDCTIMGAALAKAGMVGPLQEFLIWYAGFVREDGFVPAVVDRDGVDWIVEHDSHGQFLWAAREVERFARQDRSAGILPASLIPPASSSNSLKLWPQIRKIAEFIIKLRAQRLGPDFQKPERLACRGLFPESASHEGYLTHHVHSYWDDFWGIRGLEAAADIAAGRGESELVARWQSEAREFQRDVLASIERVISAKWLDCIPGSVEWADFDPTATSNALAQLDFAAVLPQRELTAMMDTYLAGHRRKHSGQMPWVNYTAYEVRIVGALVRMGRRHDANELLDFFLADQRPRPWHQWPEITWKNARSPGHLGDVPHTWIAAEYLLAFASLVADERVASQSLVLAAGLRWDWVATEGGCGVSKLPTRYGLLDFRIGLVEGKLCARVGGEITMPAGGVHISPPHPSEENGVLMRVPELPWSGEIDCQILP